MHREPDIRPREAAAVEHPHGRRPTGPGWYVLNATDAVWSAAPGWGSVAQLEPADARFPQVGINIHVLEPGDVSTRYHGEDAQEDFLVLAGEALLLVEGEERRLQAWDFVHCPAWTRHAFVGAGDGPCAILMIGAREGDGHATDDCVYPADPTARRHGTAGVATTWSSEEAYRDTPPSVDVAYRDATLPGA